MARRSGGSARAARARATGKGLARHLPDGHQVAPLLAAMQRMTPVLDRRRRAQMHPGIRSAALVAFRRAQGAGRRRVASVVREAIRLDVTLGRCSRLNLKTAVGLQTFNQT